MSDRDAVTVEAKCVKCGQVSEITPLARRLIATHRVVDAAQWVCAFYGQSEQATDVSMAKLRDALAGLVATKDQP